MTVAPALPGTEVSQLHSTVRTCPLVLTLLYVVQGDAEGLSSGGRKGEDAQGSVVGIEAHR